MLVVIAGTAISQQTSTTNSTELERVVVTDKMRRSKVFESSRPLNVMERWEMEQDIPVSMGDIFKKQAGLDVSTTGPNSVRPMIRGLFDDRILILLDGIRLSEQRGGGNHLLTLDPDQIYRMEAVRGPASVLYGTDAIGGVINFIPFQAGFSTAPGFRLHAENSFTYQAISEGWKNTTTVQGGAGRFNFLGQFLYQDTENITTPEGTLGNSFYAGLKGVLSARYVLDKGYISAYWYNSLADIGIPNYNSARGLDFSKSFFDDEQHNMVIVSFEKQALSPLLKTVKLDAAWQLHNRHMNILNPAATNMNVHAEIMLDIATWNINPHLVLQMGDQQLLNVGLNFFREDAASDRIFRKEYSDGSVTNTPFDGVGVIPDANRTGWGLFAQYEFSVANLTITPGLRWDTIMVESKAETGHPVSPAQKSDAAISGNLGLLWRAGKQIHISANIGRAFRAPTLLERFFYGPHQASADQGNPDLKPETGLNLDLGVKVKTGQFSGELSLFYNYLDNYIISYNTGTTNSIGQNVYTWDNVSHARLYGGEISLTLKLSTTLSLYSKAGYVLGEDLGSKENLPSIPPLKTSYGIKFRSLISNGFLLTFEAWGKSALTQDHPASSESSTEGYTIFGSSLGLAIGQHLSINLVAENLADTAYHDHLSRISWMNEQPGRSIKLNVKGRI